METNTINRSIKYIPLKDAMRELNCSKFLIYKLVDEGRLTIKKLGKKTFFSVEQINSLFEEA